MYHYYYYINCIIIIIILIVSLLLLLGMVLLRVQRVFLIRRQDYVKVHTLYGLHSVLLCVYAMYMYTLLIYLETFRYFRYLLIFLSLSPLSLLLLLSLSLPLSLPPLSPSLPSLSLPLSPPLSPLSLPLSLPLPPLSLPLPPPSLSPLQDMVLLISQKKLMH